MNKIDIFSNSLVPMIDKISELSKIQRILICVAAFLVLFSGFVYFSYYPKFKQIDTLGSRHEKLKSELETAKKNAGQLKKFQQEMKEAENNFKIASKALPETKEIPSLLTNISKSGKDSGLEFLLFQPNPDEATGFYAEIPVLIQVNGGYHNLALFFDTVSRLSRIVNLKDIDIQASNVPGSLMTKCTAVTYRFLENEIKSKP
jgi:type IV pilus assembly protein PilO